MSEVRDNMDDLFDEEFGGILSDTEPVKETKPVPEAAPKAPVQPVQKPVQTTEVKKTTEAQVASAPKGDTDEAGNRMVGFGSRISAIPIPRFKASKEMKARIAILSKQVLALKTHYVEGLGTICCLDDKCCELEGLPRVRYVVPIIQYATNKSGAPISDEIELKALSLGDEQYEALATAVEMSGRDIQDVDIIVSCSDEQYQKITFAADASKGAQWKTYPTAKALVDKYRENKGKLYMAIARKVSLDVYLAKKGFVNKAPVQVAGTTNIDDLLDE